MNKSNKYDEITHRFINSTVLFKILDFKDGRTIISFSLQGEQSLHYKVKGSVDYAKKIMENTIKHFKDIPVDCGDIDLCLRKAFSLQKTNTGISGKYSKS